MAEQTRVRRIMIVGGGYGGLACLKRLAGELDPTKYKVTLVDMSPHHAVKSRFHERAASRLRAPGVGVPLGPLVRAAGARFVCDEVVHLDLSKSTVVGQRGEYTFDLLVLAPGGRTAFFGVEGARKRAYPIDTLKAVQRCEDALSQALKRADGSPTKVVVCGAGIEGVEVVTQLRERAEPSKLSLTLVEGGEVPLPAAAFPSERERVLEHLGRRSIAFRSGCLVTAVGERGLILDGTEELEADLVIWCAGIRPVDLGKSDTELALTDEYLRVKGFENIFALGDFARVEGGDRFTNMASAQRAVYQGKLAAGNIIATERGEMLKKASYKPIGELVSLGDWDGAGEVFGRGIIGLGAAALKKFHELIYLVQILGGIPAAAVWRKASRKLRRDSSAVAPGGED